MQLSRRKMLLGSAQLIGAIGVAALPIPTFSGELEPKEDYSYRGAFAVLQGMTNSNSSQFTILFPKNKKLNYQVHDSAGNSYAIDINRREVRTFSNFGIEKIFVTGLKVGQEYILRIQDDLGKEKDERRFKALDTLKKNPRVVIASCMKDIYVDQREEMWEAVAETKADLIILNGDTCYADKDNSDLDEKGFWRRYTETRSLLAHFRLKNLTPTVAIWDDHDYGMNNGNVTWSKKDMVKEIFEIFWDSESVPEIKHGPGMSMIISVFGQRFCMMDGRYFKDPKDVTNGKYWGADQEEFLFEEIEKGKQPTWILNGTLFFGGYLSWESLEWEHEKNFKEILSRLKKIDAPVCFVSGDVHFSEIMEIEEKILGYKTHEFVSSSIHSSTFPFLHLRAKNPRRLSATSTHNFMVFDTSFDLKKNEWKIDCICYGQKLAKNCELHTTIKR